MKAKKFLGGINEYSVRLHKMRKEGQYMSYYSVNLPRYTIGEGCYREIPEKARFLGKTAVVIGGKTAMSKAKEKLLEGVKDSDVQILDFIWHVLLQRQKSYLPASPHPAPSEHSRFRM